MFDVHLSDIIKILFSSTSLVFKQTIFGVSRWYTRNNVGCAAMAVHADVTIFRIYDSNSFSRHFRSVYSSFHSLNDFSSVQRPRNSMNITMLPRRIGSKGSGALLLLLIPTIVLSIAVSTNAADSKAIVGRSVIVSSHLFLKISKNNLYTIRHFECTY